MRQQVTCPNCQGTARLMPVLSEIGLADYYRCETCGAVSLTPKDGQAVLLEFSPSYARTARPAVVVARVGTPGHRHDGV